MLNTKVILGASINEAEIKQSAKRMQDILNKVTLNPVVKDKALKSLERTLKEIEKMTTYEVVIDTKGLAIENVKRQLAGFNFIVNDLQNNLNHLRGELSKVMAVDDEYKRKAGDIEVKEQNINTKYFQHLRELEERETAARRAALERYKTQQQIIKDDRILAQQEGRAPRDDLPLISHFPSLKGAITSAINAVEDFRELHKDWTDEQIEKSQDMIDLQDRLKLASENYYQAALKDAPDLAQVLEEREQVHRDLEAAVVRLEKEMAALKLQYGIDEKTQSDYRELGASFEEVANASEKASKAVESQGNAITGLARDAEGAKTAVTKFFDRIQNFIQYTMVAQVVRAVRNFVKESLAHIRELDKALTGIATVTGKTRKEMWGMAEEFNRMARELGTTTAAIADASLIFYRQGRETVEVMDMVRASVVSASIAGISIAEASDRLTTAINGFTLASTDAMAVADKFAVLAAKSASSFDELSYALSKTASSAKAAGMDLDHTLAFIAKTIETTR